MVHIDLHAQVAFVRFTGEVDLVAASERLRALAAEPGFESGMAMLWDFSEANLRQFDTHMLRGLTFELIASLGGPPQRSALVVGRPVEFGICRMWVALSERYVPEDRWQIFWDPAEAEAWLTSSPGRETVNGG